MALLEASPCVTDMDRRSPTFTAVFALSTTLSCILITGRLSAAQQQGEKANPRSESKNTETPAKPGPVIPTPDPSPYTGKETREYNEKSIHAQQETATSTTRVAIDTERMADYTLWLVFVGAAIGGLQIGLLFFQNLYTGRAANAAKASADAVKLAERAYFDVAHEGRLENIVILGAPYQAPVVGPNAHVPIHVKMRAQNRGRTPATVTDCMVGFRVAKRLQRQPKTYRGPYTRGNRHRPQAFMVPDKRFFFYGIGTVTPSEWAAIQGGTSKLYVLGYVDYIDCFGERRRTGYARVYNPSKPAPGNNLPFFRTAGYNYDRPREQGEGNDWDKS